jgi:hypothetical protein
MHPLLAAHLLAWRKETLYPENEDFVFPSLRLKGQKPPAANMLVADYQSSGEEGWCGRATAHLRFSYLPEDASIGAGEDESRRQVGAGDIAAPKPENDSRDLRQIDVGRQVASAGNVS